ncbi:putative AMID-like mitochondrial oxidoreductase [Cadophora sp. DSE1049]|nr:putative AMID-like mitochondrial oxidoreductase [Cadophora sp. DSE1049]
MPSSDIPAFAVRYIGEILRYALTLLTQRIQSLIHRHTYRSHPTPKPIVIIGGSFSGLYLAFRLSESLPSGYKVILVEQNSHFNYTFNFPRYSAVQGREQNAFVPYAGLFGKMPKGVFEQVRGRAVGIRDRTVVLESGEVVKFEYLAIATGVTQSPPAKLLSTEKADACKELKVLQERIKEAGDIAVVGAGAVGVQLATDIKTFWPEKRVTVVHSREEILSSFGERLHGFVMAKLGGLGIEVVLEERPILPKSSSWEPTELEFKDGSKREFDLVIPCTGQTPNSSILASFSPSSISPLTHRILVNKNLQLLDGTEGKAGTSTASPNIFALGDVAETRGPKFARAGSAQAEIVRGNIVALIEGKGEKKLQEYVPSVLEGSLKLSLGKDEFVFYVQDEKRDYMFSGKGKNIDLEVAKVWKMFGADLKNAANL